MQYDDVQNNRYFATSSKVGKISLFKLGLASIFCLPTWLYGWLTRFSYKVRIAEVPGQTILPESLPERTLFFAWHQNAYLTYLLAKRPEGTVGITHDALSSLAMTLSAAYLGFKMFIFTLRDRESRIAQIAEAFKISNRLIILPDSGGPFFRLKPGFIDIAQIGEADLVPVAFHISKCWNIGSQRQHRFPLPWASIDIAFGRPVRRNGSVSHVLKECEDALVNLENALNKTKLPIS